MKYKITWDTKDLRDNRYTVYDVAGYLSNYGCNIIEQNGSSITVSTNKSAEGLYQELRRNFGIEFKVKSL